MEIAPIHSLSEAEFESLVETIVNDPARHGQLTELLHEDHEIYDQRGAATTARMRGWLLIGLARVGVSEEALIFVLEELDTGTDPYLVGAAARALRSYPKPTEAFAPFLIRAINNIRFRNDPVSFEAYGEYAFDEDSTNPVTELLTTLEWLGCRARAVLHDLEALLDRQNGISSNLQAKVKQAIAVIRAPDEDTGDACCALPAGLRNRFAWKFDLRKRSDQLETMVFEDHNRDLVTFGEFFKGQPTIVVFFYTRCDNPLKCSLTITKLARTQELLKARGLIDQINTAAVTYDPEFDTAERIQGYGRNRGVSFNLRHRMLRAIDGIEPLRRHFKLGVNFIESLVNRHRVEAYILDHRGQVAAVFERMHWEEEELVQQAADILQEQCITSEGKTSLQKQSASPLVGTLFSIGFAFFPKCPICWAAYLSVFGIAGLEQIPYSPWLRTVFAIVMMINLGSVWLRARATGRMLGFYLVSCGAMAIIGSKFRDSWPALAVVGILLTLSGSMLSALIGKSSDKLNEARKQAAKA